MEKQQYNGKTHLFIGYHWPVGNGEHCAVIIDQDFDSLEDAWDKFKKVMPDDTEVDDGYDLEEWASCIEKGTFPFLQFAAYFDVKNDLRYLLASFTPVVKGGVA